MKNLNKKRNASFFDEFISTFRDIKLKSRFVLVCICIIFASEVNSQTMPVTISAKNVDIKNIMDEIEDQTDYLFVYNTNKIDVERKISLNAKERRVADVLSTIFSNSEVTYKIEGTTILLMEKVPVVTTEVKATEQQKNVVTGVVSDENDNPLPGVLVTILGTTTGSVTSADGKYSVAVATGETLQVSFIGYQTQDIKVGTESILNVKLEVGMLAGDEVVVVGYGTMRKKDLTGAIGSVSGDDIAQRQSLNVANALQGALSGVMVTRNNGAPGSASTIRIRGITTITGTGSSPLIVVDGIPVDNMNDVNPNDIESLNVLKDAASAAIYGARAAAGVILITTKRAKGESLTFKYSYETGIEIPTDNYGWMGSTDYMTYKNESLWNDNKNKEGGEYQDYPKDLIDNYASYMEKEPNKYFDVNWRDIIKKDVALRQRHNISISGGSKFVKSNASLSYDNIDGLSIGNQKYQRITARTNNDFTINKYIAAKLDMNFSRTINNDPILDVFDEEQYAPVHAAYWDDGRYGPGRNGNTVAMANEGGFIDKFANKISGRAALNITPIEGLKISAILAPSFRNSKQKKFIKQIPIYSAEDPTVLLRYVEEHEKSKLDEARNDSHSLTTQFFANYDREFDKHNISIMGGYENYYYKSESLGASRDQYLHTNYPYLNIGPETYRDNGGSAYETAYRSYFGRISYNYDDRYLIQANVRYDGSSRFHNDYRWGTFPSVSAGWIISEENFMKNQKLVSFLKLRASYGSLGNERIGNYPYQALLNFGNSIFLQGNDVASLGSAYQSHYAIQDISWETTTSIDLGVDIYMFDDRLRFAGDIYSKETKDMLLALEIPDYVGFDNPQQNTGKMSTRGFDLDIAWSDRIGDFSYSVGVNFSNFKSKMGDLGGTEFLGEKVKMQGSEFDEWYGYVSEGIYQTQEEVDNSAKLSNSVRPGDVRYKDISGPDGVPDGKISAEYDRVLLGGSLPQYMYGGNIRLGYKGIDLSVVFQGIGKQNTNIKTQIKPNSNNAGRFPVEYVNESYFSHYNTPEQNANAKYPRFSAISMANNYASSNFWTFNGGYFRVKNVTLGYTIPTTFTDKLLIKNLRFYVSVNDLLSIDNYPKGIDPESPFRSYPITTTILGGVSVTF